MSFEQQILLQRILLPGLASILGCWLLLSSKSESGGNEDASYPHARWKTLLGCLLIGGSLLVSDFWQRDLLWDPAAWTSWTANYRWQWMIWGIPGAVLGLGLLRAFSISEREQAAMAWPALCLLSIGTHYLAIFEPETWPNWLIPMFHAILIGSAASILNIASLHSMVATGASRWSSLILLAQLGCVAAIAVQSYASLGEWVLTGIGITLGATCVSFFYSAKSRLFGVWPLAVVLYPIVISASASLLLTGYFRSRPLPIGLTGVVLFLPTLVAFLDFVYGRYGRVWFRVALAAVTCIAVLVAVIFMTEPFKSEW
jgi:hypothetical protein